MRIIGIVAAYNEELVIAACLEHHIAQGIELYLLDNESTDETVTIAQQYLGHGLIAIEPMSRHGLFDVGQLLTRKQELAGTLDADWFMHLDADEMRLGPRPGQTLAQAIGDADAAGYNAVNFIEFTFVPTIESPDHEHAHFQETMRWYYPFLPKLLHRVNAWKKQSTAVDLVTHSGHRVLFPGQFIYPLPFQMRHYQFLSVAHAIRKYAQRRHPPKALARGKHGWREQLDPSTIRLPSQSQLHEIDDTGWLDFSQPRSTHVLDSGAAGRGTLLSSQQPMSSDLARVPARSLARALVMKMVKRLRPKSGGRAT